MSTSYSKCLSEAINHCRSEASRAGRDHIGPAHLLLGVLHQGSGSALDYLRQLGVSLAILEIELLHLPSPATWPPPALSTTEPFTFEAEQVLYLAQRESSFWGEEQVQTIHLLLGLLREDSIAIGVSSLLARLGLDYQFLFDTVAYARVGLPFG